MKIKSNLNLMICLLLLISLALLHCTAQKPNYEFLIADAIHQAIALEKLEHIQGITKVDTIYILASDKVDSLGFNFSEEFNNYLPSHIDKWYIKGITHEYIKNASASQQFDFVIMYVSEENNNKLVEFILETKFPPNDELYNIDRPRLILYYKLKGNIWQLRDVYKWWG